MYKRFYEQQSGSTTMSVEWIAKQNTWKTKTTIKIFRIHKPIALTEITQLEASFSSLTFNSVRKNKVFSRLPYIFDKVVLFLVGETIDARNIQTYIVGINFRFLENSWQALLACRCTMFCRIFEIILWLSFWSPSTLSIFCFCGSSTLGREVLVLSSFCSFRKRAVNLTSFVAFVFFISGG